MMLKRKCKNCGELFKPIYSSTQPVCSIECSIAYSKLLKLNKEAKERKEETKVMKEKLLTHKDYIQVLQKLVNTYVRMRDAKEGCISCEKPLNNKFDAGHMYPTTYQFLRFHEDNINGQCVRCNRDLHGNAHEYAPRLEKKIGFDRMQWLHAHRHDRLELTIEDLKELIIKYKLKIKEL